eukprot:2572960-Rhodomonas_salina.4
MCFKTDRPGVRRGHGVKGWVSGVVDIWYAPMHPEQYLYIPQFNTAFPQLRVSCQNLLRESVPLIGGNLTNTRRRSVCATAVLLMCTHTLRPEDEKREEISRSGMLQTRVI